jgi:hypothetical protein
MQQDRRLVGGATEMHINERDGYYALSELGRFRCGRRLLAIEA